MGGKNISGVYEITNLINNKIYIGSSINIKKRWKDHILLLKNQKHINVHLLNAWNKYGEENFSFSIIEEIYPKEKENRKDFIYRVREREFYYIDKFNATNSKIGYNLSKKTQGSDSCGIRAENFDKNSKNYTREQFVQMLYLFTTTDISIAEISRITGVKSNCVYAVYYRNSAKDLTEGFVFQKRNKIELEKIKNNQELKNKIIDSFNNGKNYKQIKEELQIPLSTIKRFCKENNLMAKRTFKKVYIYDLYGNFIKQCNSQKEAYNFLEVTPEKFYGQISGRIRLINNKYWCSFEKKQPSFTIYENIVGQLMNKKENPIMKIGKNGNIIIFLKSSFISSLDKGRAKRFLPKKDIKLKDIDGNSWIYLQDLDKNIIENFLAQKTTGRIKILKGENINE